MSSSGKLTTLQQTEAARLAKAAAADKPKREFSEAEKTVRRERVAQAKEALANSVGTTGPFPPTSYFSVWPWSAGFGTRVSDPELATSAGTGVAFSARGDFIAITQESSPRISVFPWSGGAFGARVSNPGTLPTGTARGVAFNRITKPYVG